MFRATWAVAPPPEDIPVAELDDAAEDIPVAELDTSIAEVLPVVRPAPAPARVPPRLRLTKSLEEVLWWRGNCTYGVTVQAGVVVLRPDFVAFLPTEQAVNVMGMISGHVLKGFGGVQTVSLDWFRRRPDPVRMLEDLWDEYPDHFDSYLRDIVGGLGGRVWLQSTTQIVRGRNPFFRRSEGVRFFQGGVNVIGNAPRGDLLNRLLQGWKDGEPPIWQEVYPILLLSLLPLFMAVALFIMHLTSDGVPFWGPLIPLGMASVFYVAIGIHLVKVWLRRKSKRRSQDEPLAESEA